MAKNFQLAIVAPDRSVMDEPVQSVVVPGAAGYLGVLAGHLPMVAALKPGIVEYLGQNNQRQYVAVGGGFAEVTPNRVTILADSADLATEINVSSQEAALEEALKALRGENSSMNSEEATLEVERAMARIRAAKKV